MELTICTMLIGDNADSSRTLIVQYWKSSEHLAKYAASSTNKHYSPWKNLMQLAKSTSDYGFWHGKQNIKV